MGKQHKTRSWPHKVRPVSVSQMQVPEAGVSQRKYSKSQAEEYAAVFDPNKFGIPAVNWRDAVYWIVDGQHRIEALKLWFAPSDPGDVLCNVYEGLTDAEMAELFRGLNTRRAVHPFDMFLVSCTAGRERETAIRRTVESQGLRICRRKEECAVAAVGALGKVYDRLGEIVLGQTLRTLKSAYGGDPAAFDGSLIEGCSFVYGRFNGKTSEKDLAARLATIPQGVRGLVRRAEAQRERTGNQKTQCIAAAIVDAYNRGAGPRTKDRLPGWWKEV